MASGDWADSGEFTPTQDRSWTTRAQILEAGTALLREGGASNLTVANAAARAEVSVGSVYRRFGDKDRLFVALQKQFVEEFLSILQVRIDAAETVTPLTDRQAIGTAIDIFVATFAEREELLRVFTIEGIRNPAVRKIGALGVRAANDAFHRVLLLGGISPRRNDTDYSSDYAFRLVYGLCSHRICTGPDLESDVVHTWEETARELTRIVTLYLLGASD